MTFQWTPNSTLELVTVQFVSLKPGAFHLQGWLEAGLEGCGLIRPPRVSVDSGSRHTSLYLHHSFGLPPVSREQGLCHAGWVSATLPQPSVVSLQLSLSSRLNPNIFVSSLTVKKNGGGGI